MAQHDHPYRRQGGDYEEYGRRQRPEFDEDYDEMSSGSGYGRESGRRQYGQGSQYGQYDQGATGGAYRGRPEGQRGGASSGMAGLGYGYGYGNEPGYGWREELDQGRFQQRGRFGQGPQGGMREEYGRREQRDPYTGYAMGSPRYGDDAGWGREDAGQRQYFDPDYYQWRNEQMSALDDDYRNWRQDRYKKFSDEFSTWRNSRQKNQASGSDDDASRSGTSDTGSGTGSSTSKSK